MQFRRPSEAGYPTDPLGVCEQCSPECTCTDWGETVEEEDSLLFWTTLFVNDIVNDNDTVLLLY